MGDGAISTTDDAALHDWLERAGCDAAAIAPLAGDVSPRRYFRLPRGAGSVILALYPTEIHATLERFLATGALLAAAGVRVPRVVDCARELGAMLLEDLGPHTLFDAPRDWPALAPRLAAAVEAGARVGALERGRVAALNPPLDRSLLERELAKTRDSFLVPRRLLAAGERAAWDEFARQLAARLGEQEPRPCHRDFMARNLVALAEGGLAVLDHQDLRLGPPVYDIASLLNDSLFVPAALEGELLEIAGMAREPERTGYRRAAVQRGFKAVGTFAAFAERGVPRHLPLIAPTGRRALEHLASLPERALLPEALRHRLAEAFC